MPRTVITPDARPWWRSPLARMAALTALTALVGAAWVDHAEPPAADPAAPRARPALPPPSDPVAPAPQAAMPQPEPAPTTPLSIQLAPGVHLTPLSVPDGAVPQPAGPRPDDSEPEN